MDNRIPITDVTPILEARDAAERLAKFLDLFARKLAAEPMSIATDYAAGMVKTECRKLVKLMDPTFHLLCGEDYGD